MDFLTSKAGDPALKLYLDGLVTRFERQEFIDDDPVSLVHGFADLRDQEVIGLFSALLAWGRRDTMLRKLHDLAERMRFSPYRFVLEFEEARDAEALAGFGHRTFRPEDAVSLVRALSAVLHRHGTLEQAFLSGLPDSAPDIGPGIEAFSRLIGSIVEDTPARLRKHLARPSSGSACKRLCLYLRWMARPGPVDLGIWKGLDSSRLVLPLDVHSGRQARLLGLLERPLDDWRAALELTERCRALDTNDPARYDFAFFGVGAYRVRLDLRFVVPA